MQKRIGIAVDNYKLPRYREEIAKEGFEIKSENYYTKDITIIHIITDVEKVEKLGNMCTRLEIHFKTMKQ